MQFEHTVVINIILLLDIFVCCKTFKCLTVLMLKYNTSQLHIYHILMLLLLVLIQMTVDSVFNFCIPHCIHQHLLILILFHRVLCYLIRYLYINLLQILLHMGLSLFQTTVSVTGARITSSAYCWILITSYLLAGVTFCETKIGRHPINS